MSTALSSVDGRVVFFWICEATCATCPISESEMRQGQGQGQGQETCPISDATTRPLFPSATTKGATAAAIIGTGHAVPVRLTVADLDPSFARRAG